MASAVDKKAGSVHLSRNGVGAIGIFCGCSSCLLPVITFPIDFWRYPHFLRNVVAAPEERGAFQANTNDALDRIFEWQI